MIWLSHQTSNLVFWVQLPARTYSDVAQLVSVFGSYPEGRWFKSTRRYFYNKNLIKIKTATQKYINLLNKFMKGGNIQVALVCYLWQDEERGLEKNIIISFQIIKHKKKTATQKHLNLYY